MKYSPEQRKAQSDLAESTLLFGKVLMPNSFRVNHCPIHYEWDKDLHDDSLLRLNYKAPRKTAKTTIMARTYPLQKLLTSVAMGEREYILLIGKTQRSVAAKSLYHIKWHLTYNQKIREIYGDLGKSTAQEWGKFGVILENGTIIEAIGLGQPISGQNLLDLRPTLIILDDVQDIHNTKTEEVMSFHVRWLLGEVEPALDDDGRIINIATPKHELALVEQLKKNPEWKTEEYDHLVSEATEDEPGVTIWPEKMSYEQLKGKERSASSLNALREFYREYRCQLTSGPDQLFRPEFFMYYRGGIEHDANGNTQLRITHIWQAGEEPREVKNDLRYVNTFTGVDPASSQKEGAAYSTIVTIAYDSQKNIFVLPYFKKRVTPSALKEEIEKRFITYRPSWTTVEENGYQVMLKEQLRDSDLMMPGLHQKKISRDPKDLRHQRLEPYFYQRKVYFMEGMESATNELLLYPRGTRDWLDGFEFATTRMFPPNPVTSAYRLTTKKELARRNSWLVA